MACQGVIYHNIEVYAITTLIRLHVMSHAIYPDGVSVHGVLNTCSRLWHISISLHALLPQVKLAYVISAGL